MAAVPDEGMPHAPEVHAEVGGPDCCVERLKGLVRSGFRG